MNELAILNAMYNGIILKCTFDARFTVSQKIHENQSKLYSYKCNIPGVEVGDEVLVESPDGYIRSVVVIEIADSLDMEPDVSYKWILDKIDRTDYNTLKANDANAIRELRRLRQANVRRQMIQSSGIGQDELDRILKITSGE